MMLLGAFSHLEGSTFPFHSAPVFQSGRGTTIHFLPAVPLDRGHRRAEEDDLQADKFFGGGAEEFEAGM